MRLGFIVESIALVARFNGSVGELSRLREQSGFGVILSASFVNY